MNTEQITGPACEFCGLPVLTSRFRRRSATPLGTPLYCCSGCRLAASILAAESKDGHAHRILLRLGFAAFCTMNVLAFSMALWSRDVYAGHESDNTVLAGAINDLFRYATLLFALPVLILLGGPLLANAWQAIRRGVITADILIVLGVVGAYTYSVISVVRGEGRIYFEVGCVVMAFLTLGRWFEATGKFKMGQALDELAKLLPNAVHQVYRDTIRDVPRESIQVGDTLRVLAGERFGVDGRIIAGMAEIDEQLVTGESRAIFKAPGDLIFSGTLNLDGDLRVAVTAAAGQETVSRLLEAVRKARRAPGEYQRLTDRIAVWFVPMISAVAIATAANRGYTESIDAGILSGLAVVLIACPCAFGLATPMAIWTAMGRAARGHVLFRSGQALEQLARVDSMHFDKTGTITSGDSDVETLVLADSADRREVIATADALAAASNHTFSLAIRRYAASRSQTRFVGAVTTIPGKGLTACVDLDSHRETIYLGSRRLMEEHGLAIARSLDHAVMALGPEKSFAFIGWAKCAQGLFVLREQIRPEAPAAFDACRRMGLQTTVLTGDSAPRAVRLAKQLGARVISERLPEEKVTAVELARRARQVVGMVGDGINDAPALAAADVGIAMGCGADLTRDSAAVCLLSNDLTRLPWAISLARRTVRIIHQNLFWAFVYNIAGIGLAVSGRLNPVWAGAAMAASSILVVTNSLRLNRFPEPGVATYSSPTLAHVPDLNFNNASLRFDHQSAQIAATSNDLQPTP